MAAKRILLGAILAGALGGPPAFGQSGPSLLPGGVAVTPPAASGTGAYLPPPAGTGSGGPLLSPPAGGGAGMGATGALTAPPGVTAGGLPPGSVGSPWCGGVPAGAAACCGPVGANGPISYDLYLRTGSNVVVGGNGGPFLQTIGYGWTVAGGGRTLLLNQAGDAGWALDLGLMYTYNGGESGQRIVVLTPQATAENGQLLGPDQPAAYELRSLHRTAFTYAIGRDWFLNGPGYVRPDGGWNTRFGVDVGGRYGTAHVDLIPLDNPLGYFRKQNIFHSVTLAAHYDWEKAVGAYIVFGGFRAEYGYTWTNLVPPQDGDIQDFNFLLSLGVRF